MATFSKASAKGFDQEGDAKKVAAVEGIAEVIDDNAEKVMELDSSILCWPT